MIDVADDSKVEMWFGSFKTFFSHCFLLNKIVSTKLLNLVVICFVHIIMSKFKENVFM